MSFPRNLKIEYTLAREERSRLCTLNAFSKSMELGRFGLALCIIFACHFKCADQLDLNASARPLQNWMNMVPDWAQNALPWLSTRMAVAIVLTAMAASLSSAGGVGGGGLFVPIFYLLLRFDMRTSAAFSNFLIAGSMLANAIWSSRQVHPIIKNKPMVDYTIGIWMQPNMLLGISFGVFCNIMFPSWLITILLTILLVYVTSRSCKTGVKLWTKESASDQRALHHENGVLAVKNEHGSVSSVEIDDSLSQPLLAPENGLKGPSWIPSMELVVMICVWLMFTLIQILKDSKTNKYLFRIQPCGVGYWLLTALQIPFALLVTAWAISQNPIQNSAMQSQGSQIRYVLPAMSFIAGVLGGMLGIGGGMIINPILLGIGVHPQVTASTTALMVLFSSSQSVVQFWLMGSVPVEEALYFSALCFVFSIVGVVAVKRAIQKLGRVSVLVFVVSSVMGLSAILLAVFGALDEWQEYKAGGYMGFRPLC